MDIVGWVVDLGSRAWSGMGGAPGAATVLAGVVTGIGGVWGGTAAIVRIFRHRAEASAEKLQVHRIVDETDPNLIAVDRLQRASFGDDVEDDTQQLMRYVVESPRGRAKRGSKPYFLAFVLKYKRVACGYLTAQYFPDARTIFLWYVAVELDEVRRQRDEGGEGWDPDEVAFHGCTALISAMLEAANRTGVPWAHVVTEVVTGQEVKARLFNMAARKLSQKAGRKTVPVLALPLSYAEPVLRLDQIGGDGDHGKAARLLYAPKEPVDGLRRVEDGSYVMAKWLAMRLLDTLLLGSYAQIFPESAEYRQYCHDAYQRYVDKLPDPLVLLPAVRSRRRKTTDTPNPASAG